MSSQVRPVYLHPVNQAEALCAALNRLGFNAELLKQGGHQQHPCIVIGSGPARIMHATEYVYAGPDQASQWWFWVSSSRDDPVDLEPVAPISDVSATADHLARALTRARVQGLQAS